MLLSRHWARFIFLGLLLLTTACAGLSNEPQIVATLVPPTASPAELGYPAAPPDLTNGASIYAARCASCHGITGAGDGELVTSGQLAIDNEVIQPANFLDPATARDQTPLEWFTTITNGRIERLMPPWAQALTEQERWDVAYYTYTLHYTQEQITRGRELWEIECVDCHGIEGRGDGPEADDAREQVEDLTNQYDMAISSDQVLFNFVNEGSADAMPAYGEEYTAEQMWDVVAFSRTLALTNTDVIGQPPVAPTEAVTEAAPVTLAPDATGTVTGQITNGTEGSMVPANLPVSLFLLDAQGGSQEFETTTDSNNRFEFTDVPMRADVNYFTVVDYRSRPFSTGVIGGAPNLELPITIYELTEDPSVIQITRLAYETTAVADGLQVRQVLILTNTSDRLFTSGRTVGENRYASLFITLPPGAAVLGFPGEEGRYIVSDDQTTVIDTAGVLPNRDHLVQMIYFIPYGGSAIIEQPVNYALNGMVVLLLRPDSVTAASDQLPPMGPQQVGSNTYAGYGAELTLNAGDVIRYELNGTGVSTTTQLEPPGVASNNLIVIVVLALVGVAVLIGVVYRLNQRPNGLAIVEKVNKQQLMDALLKQIAELDEAEARGEINHDLYHHQRKQLKARLAELMEESD